MSKQPLNTKIGELERALSVLDSSTFTMVQDGKVIAALEVVITAAKAQLKNLRDHADVGPAASATQAQVKLAPPCDPEIARNGKLICTFAAPSTIAESWVVKVREKSGQRVDWHYVGGRVKMLYIGDYDKVRAAIEGLFPELDAACRELHEREGGMFKDIGVEAFQIWDKGT